MRLVRWLLVVPAAVGAWLGIQLLVILGTAIGGSVIPFLDEAYSSQVLGTILGSFAFIDVGARVAPSRRLSAAISLAIVQAAFVIFAVSWVASKTGASMGSTIVWPIGDGPDYPTDPMWWVLLAGVLAIGSSVVACIAVDRRYRDDDASSGKPTLPNSAPEEW